MPVVTKELKNILSTGLTVTIRQLSYWQVRNAKKTFTDDAIEQARKLGDLRQMIQEERRRMDEEKKVRGILEEPAPEKDPSSEYDMPMTLHYGIVSWSYAEELTDANIDDLLATGEAEYIFKEIVAFSERTPADTKGSGGQSVPTSEPATAPGQ